MNALSGKIKTLQRQRDLKNIELAKLAGIPNSTLADILKGKTARVSVQNLKSLAAALDCSVDYLLDERPDDAIGAVDIPDGHLSPEESELIAVHRRLDRRGRELLVAMARQQLAYQDRAVAAAPAAIPEKEEWRRYVGTVTAARGGVRLVDENEARELAVIKRAFLED